MHMAGDAPVGILDQSSTRVAVTAAPTMRRGTALPIASLILWLALAGPLFVRMPLTNDAILFDLQARLLSQGDVLYRDILEPNLPGVVWIHQAVRAVAGTSSEALRVSDLLIFSGILAAAYVWMRRSNASPQHAFWTVAACSVFYFSASEWIHCQRDTWMLLPILLAGNMRFGTDRCFNSPPRRFWNCVLEGCIWGVGVWIKPYVALVGLACWTVELLRSRNLKKAVIETTGLLAGGLAVGAAGVGWLVAVGSWPDFLETLSSWNPHYYAAGRENWTLPRFVAMAARFSPWVLLHALAVPISLRILTRVIRPPAAEIVEIGNLRESARVGLATIYLITLFHVFFLQHLFDYVHAPAIVLATLVVGQWAAACEQRSLVRVATISFVVLVLMNSPVLTSRRINLWRSCVVGPNRPELQDQLAHFENPQRADLEKVAQFLEQKGLSARSVACFNSDCIGLYDRLGLHPPTRYVYLYEILVYFPFARDQIMAELSRSGHQFVVTDLVSSGMARRDAEAVGPTGPLAPPPKYPRWKDTYPWSHRPVFRAGTYLVHEVSGSLGNVRLPGDPKDNDRRAKSP